MWLSGLIDNICCWLDDLIVKIDVLTFKINQKIKEIETIKKERD